MGRAAKKQSTRAVANDPKCSENSGNSSVIPLTEMLEDDNKQPLWQDSLQWQKFIIQQNGGQKAQFESQKRLKRTRQGKLKGHRPKIHHLLGLTGQRVSCALGVPAAKRPVLQTPRSRQQLFRASLLNQRTSRLVQLYIQHEAYRQQKPQPDLYWNGIKNFVNLESGLQKRICLDAPSPASVSSEDQFDFLNSELRPCPTEKNTLRPFGEIPHSGGIKDFRPYRAPDAWIYLFKRGLTLFRKGPNPKDPRLIPYDFEYLKWLEGATAQGRHNLMSFFDENLMKVRSDILAVIVEQVFEIEQNGPEKKVAAGLPVVGDVLWEEGEFTVVLLANGIGLKRIHPIKGDERASKLNVSVMQLFGMNNFNWPGNRVHDYYQIAKEQGLPIPSERLKPRGVKTSPAISLHELFRWAWSARKILHPNKPYIIPDFVMQEMKIAQKRDFATKIFNRSSEIRREIIAELQAKSKAARETMMMQEAFENDLQAAFTANEQKEQEQEGRKNTPQEISSALFSSLTNLSLVDPPSNNSEHNIDYDDDSRHWIFGDRAEDDDFLM